MSRAALTPAKAALLMVGVGTVALMGIPGLYRYSAPDGGIVGRVLDTGGQPLEDVEVALFGESTGLVEIAHSDDHGRFAFGTVPLQYRVFASRAGDAELLGAWAVGRERRVRNEIEVTLRRGTSSALRILDPRGRAVPEAEVRVLDLGQEGAAIQRVLTDASGRATVALPPRARLAVLHPTQPGVQWFTPAGLVQVDDGLDLRLRATAPLVGEVRDAEGAGAQGAIVTAWEELSGEWCGWARADAHGRFRLDLPETRIRLRVADPTDRLAPSGTALEFRRDGPTLELTLAAAVPMAVSLREPRTALDVRLRTWSEEGGAWSWGRFPDEEGTAVVPAAPHDLLAAVDRAGRPVPARAIPQATLELESNTTPLALGAVED